MHGDEPRLWRIWRNRAVPMCPGWCWCTRSLVFVQCDHYLTSEPFWSLWKELAVNRVSMRALTWGTVLAALVSAFLLAGEDAGLPDAAQLGGAVSVSPAR